MTDDRPAHVPEVPLAAEQDDEEDEADPNEDPELPDAVRERLLRETVDDEAEQRHRAARETANPDDHRDEAPNNS